MVETSANNPVELNDKGVGLLQEKHFSEALSFFEKALANQPDFGKAWCNKASSLFYLNRWPEALNAFERAVDFVPLFPEAWYSKALAEKKMELWTKSGISFQFFLALASLQHKPLMQETRLALKELTEKGFRSKPAEALAWIVKGYKLATNPQQVTEALTCFDNALLQASDITKAWQYKGMCFNALGRPDEALNCYVKAIELDQNNAVYWYNKGVILSQQGRLEDAVTCYTRTVDIDPQYSEAWNNRGRDLGVLKRYDECILSLNKATSLLPKSEIIWFNKGLVEDEIGQKEPASLSYQKFLELASPKLVKQIEHARKRLLDLGRTQVPPMQIDKTMPPPPPKGSGQFIGQKYEIHKVLGKGGFGIVYLVYSNETRSFYAMKTFRDEFLLDDHTRAMFKKEAQVLVDLDSHPYLIKNYFVEEIAGRLYIVMEYIASDEPGLNILEGYIERQPPDLIQSLRWAIQFCHGMEFAYAKGIRCHRDIKPANIMINQQKMVKISDFGLAGIISSIEKVSRAPGIKPSVLVEAGQTRAGASFGTPSHMPSEQFENAAACDERSDIYAFGIVLYQMASAGAIPFMAKPPQNNTPQEFNRFWDEMHRLHQQAPVPLLDSPLFPIIQKCLAKNPAQRFPSFSSLRQKLELHLLKISGEVVNPPDQKEMNAAEWLNKGLSLKNLGRFSDAQICYDKALELNPAPDTSSLAWSNKGSCFLTAGRVTESIESLDKAIELNPKNEKAWSNKGFALHQSNRFQEALACYDKAIESLPNFAIAWNNKAFTSLAIRDYDRVIQSADQALKFDPRLDAAWINKGAAFYARGLLKEALACYDKALEINPRGSVSWYNKGLCLTDLQLHREAVAVFDRAIEINPLYEAAWCQKGNTLLRLSNPPEAIRCFDKALEINPNYASALYYKAYAFLNLRRNQEAIACFQKFLKIAPADNTMQIQDSQNRLREVEGRR